MRNYLLFILFLTILFSGCRSYKQIELTGIKDFQINKLSPEGIDGNLLIGIKNPNPFGFSIFKSDFDVTYSQVYLGKAQLAKRVKIKANEENTYVFNIKSSFKDVQLTDIMKLLSGGSFKNVIEVKGDLKAGKFFIHKKFPVNLTDKVKLN